MYGMNSIWRLSGTLVMEKNSYGIAGGNESFVCLSELKEPGQKNLAVLHLQ